MEFDVQYIEYNIINSFWPRKCAILNIIIICIANKTLAGKAIQYNTTLQNIYT